MRLFINFLQVKGQWIGQSRQEEKEGVETLTKTYFIVPSMPLLSTITGWHPQQWTTQKTRNEQLTMKLFSGILKSWALGKHSRKFWVSWLSKYAQCTSKCLQNQMFYFYDFSPTNVNPITVANTERKLHFMLHFVLTIWQECYSP